MPSIVPSGPGSAGGGAAAGAGAPASGDADSLGATATDGGSDGDGDGLGSTVADGVGEMVATTTVVGRGVAAGAGRAVGSGVARGVGWGVGGVSGGGSTLGGVGAPPVMNVHPSTVAAAGREAAAPTGLYRHAPPRSAVQYDQEAVAAGMVVQDSDEASGSPSIRHTKAGCVVTGVTAKPAPESAARPLPGRSGTQRVIAPPPKAPKSTTTVTPAEVGQAPLLHAAAPDGTARQAASATTAARDASFPERAIGWSGASSTPREGRR